MEKMEKVTIRKSSALTKKHDIKWLTVIFRNYLKYLIKFPPFSSVVDKWLTQLKDEKWARRKSDDDGEKTRREFVLSPLTSQS